MIQIISEPGRYAVFATVMPQDLPEPADDTGSVWRFVPGNTPVLQKAKGMRTAMPAGLQLVGLDDPARAFLEDLERFAGQLNPEDAENLMFSLVEPARVLAQIKAGAAEPGVAVESGVEDAEPAPDSGRGPNPIRWVVASFKKLLRAKSWPGAGALLGIGLLIFGSGYLLGRMASRVPAALATQTTKPSGIVAPVNPGPSEPDPNEPWADIQKDWQRPVNRTEHPDLYALARGHAFPGRKGAIERFALATLKKSLHVTAPPELDRPGVFKQTLEALRSDRKRAAVDPDVVGLVDAVLCDHQPRDSQLGADEKVKLRQALDPNHPVCPSSAGPSKEHIRAAVDVRSLTGAAQ